MNDTPDDLKGDIFYEYLEFMAIKKKLAPVCGSKKAISKGAKAILINDDFDNEKLKQSKNNVWEIYSIFAYSTNNYDLHIKLNMINSNTKSAAKINN